MPPPYWGGGIITLCYTPTHASNRCRLKSFTSCGVCDGLAAPDFVMKCIEVRAVQRPEIWKFVRVIYIITLLDWRQ